MALHLSMGLLKTRCTLEPVPICEPITYQHITDDIATEPSGPVTNGRKWKYPFALIDVCGVRVYVCTNLYNGFMCI